MKDLMKLWKYTIIVVIVLAFCKPNSLAQKTHQVNRASQTNFQNGNSINKHLFHLGVLVNHDHLMCEWVQSMKVLEEYTWEYSIKLNTSHTCNGISHREFSERTDILQWTTNSPYSRTNIKFIFPHFVFHSYTLFANMLSIIIRCFLLYCLFGCIVLHDATFRTSENNSMHNGISRDSIEVCVC